MARAKASQAVGVVAAPEAPDMAAPLAPEYLTLAELAEWAELAPRAVKQGTLTDVEVPALVDLCRSRVLLAKLLRVVDQDGITVATPTGAMAAHPVIAKYATLHARVDGAMLRFGLTPNGRVEKQAPQQVDPFAAFDGPMATHDDEIVN